jgi:hypothetical protein
MNKKVNVVDSQEDTKDSLSITKLKKSVNHMNESDEMKSVC